MDPVSREVLSRKDFMLKNYLQWNEEFTNALREKLVINEENVNKIRKARENLNKTVTLIERMKCKGRPGELETLASALDNTRKSFVPEWFNMWISDEIREELAAEQSALEINDNISRECATIVHREFGHTKRLSELEKKTLVKILRDRTQLTKNIWKTRCETVKADVEEQKDMSDWKDERAEDIGTYTAKYVNENRPRVKEGQVRLTRQTSKAPLLGDSSTAPKDPLVILKNGISDMRRILSDSLLSSETLRKDRIRVLRNMGLSDDQIAETLLDEEIKLALERNAQKIADADRRLIGREGEYDDILLEIAEVKRQHKKKMETKEKNLHILEGEYEKANDKADDLEEQGKKMRRELAIAKLELGEWIDWHQSIDHGKRLNDIYQRDLPKLKGKKLQEDGKNDDVAVESNEGKIGQQKQAKQKFTPTRGKLRPIRSTPTSKRPPLKCQ